MAVTATPGKLVELDQDTRGGYTITLLHNATTGKTFLDVRSEDYVCWSEVPADRAAHAMQHPFLYVD